MTCPRCGGPTRRRGVALLLLAPLVLGVGAVLLVRYGTGALSPIEMLVIVTAAFVLLIGGLGTLARAWLREECPACRRQGS